MLKKLRFHMALLSTLLTGAVLLLMAFYAMAAAQQSMAAQFEGDLLQMSRSTRSVITALSPSLRVQYINRYSAVYRYGSQTQYMSFGQEPEVDILENISFLAYSAALDGPDTRQVDSADADTHAFAMSPLRSNAGGVQSFYYRQGPIIDKTVLLELDKHSYRVAVTLTSRTPLTPQTELYVIQDRHEELMAAGELRRNFLFVSLGGLLLMFLTGFYLSGRSIRPVEASFRQQRDFVAAASHELRTPVAAIRANAEVLADAELKGFTPYLSAITLESERMSRLVGDLLDLARADAGQWQLKEETVCLRAVTDRVSSLFTPLAAKEGVTFTVESQDVNIKADEERLIQTLAILVDNAMRHGKPGGCVRLYTNREDKNVVLRVEDDGPGIAPEYTDRVFERFYRLDSARSGGGSGLGLSIARLLTESMGGTLILSSSGDMGGALFELRFPAL